MKLSFFIVLLANPTYNILLCSLGPKLSTMEFFKFQKVHTECGLIYIGSKDYCKDYSSGIDLDNPILVPYNYFGN